MKLFIFAVICVLHIANAMPENRVESTESSQSTEVNNTYIFGEKTDYDNIMSTTISRNAVEDTVLEEIVTFPFEGMYNPHVKVKSRVKCVIHNDYNKDRKTDVEIINGGINQSFITLRIRSERGKGLQSYIRFFAHSIQRLNDLHHHFLSYKPEDHQEEEPAEAASQ